MPQPPITIKTSLFEEAQAAAHAVHHRRMAELENMRQMLALLDELRPALAEAGFEPQAKDLFLDADMKSLHWQGFHAPERHGDSLVQVLRKTLGFALIDELEGGPYVHARLARGPLSIWLIVANPTPAAEGLQA